MNRIRTNSWVESLVCGLLVWILVALIALWLNLPMLFMHEFGFSGVLAGVIGFYVITYPAFIFPVLFRVSRKGETISEKVRIMSFIHYAVVLSLLGGFGFYLLLVSVGFSPALAFSIGPPLIGILAIGFLYLVFRLEKWWKLRREKMTDII
ncbi:MAG: hypothetical protein ACFFCH_00445 [Promethearchaeota archaeon]